MLAALRQKFDTSQQRWMEQRFPPTANVTLNLRLSREEGAGELTVSPSGLNAVIAAMACVEAEAMQAGLSLAPATAADILGIRGVLETRSLDSDTGLVLKALIADFETVLADFEDMRRA